MKTLGNYVMDTGFNYKRYIFLKKFLNKSTGIFKGGCFLFLMYISTKSMAVSEERHYLKKILSAQHNFTDTPKAGEIRGSCWHSESRPVGSGICW